MKRNFIRLLQNSWKTTEEYLCVWWDLLMNTRKFLYSATEDNIFLNDYMAFSFCYFYGHNFFSFYERHFTQFYVLHLFIINFLLLGNAWKDQTSIYDYWIWLFNEVLKNETSILRRSAAASLYKNPFNKIPSLLY